MRIDQNLNIVNYELIESQNQGIYPDQIMEGTISYTGATGGATSNYIIGGHTSSGELFFQGLDFQLKPLFSASGATETSSGSSVNYLAGMALRSDGALALVGSSKDGRIWVNLFPSPVNNSSATTYLIDIDGGNEEAYDVALLPGDRLLIGGRAEAVSSSGYDDAQATLLEVDLNTATINWARTYGNANYPESMILDVYADSDGFLLSGFGVTPAGVSVGGFGKLNHFDSWLAATDTLGRVFECDCYEDTYATVISIPYGFGGDVLTFTSVNKGRDDLLQDQTKAPISNYFCDQYQPVVGPVCCGGEDQDRMELVADIEISEDGQDWVVANPNLPECFTVQVDWGDGNIETVPAEQLPARHTYAVGGDYDICITFQALAADGTVCWEESRCEVVTGAEDIRLVADLTVYPNPTEGTVYLRFPAVHGKPAVRVFTVTGQPVRNIPNMKGNTLSLGGLPSGMYLLDVRFPDGAVARRKVMVR